MKRLSTALVALALTGVAALHAAPLAPTNLVSTVTANTVSLSWTAPLGALLGYRLEAGTGPSLSNVANVVIGATTTFSAPSVPPGTYYVRVRAIAADGESAPSNEVVVVVGPAGGCTAAPSAPTNLTSALTGTTVNIAWTPGSGCPATHYVLQAGSAPGLANIATVNVGQASSFSAMAPPGTYYLRVVAQNAFGSSGASNEVNLVVGGTTTGLGPLAGTVNANAARLSTVTMPVTGQYRATLTWSDPTADLDFYLATIQCLFYPPLPCLLTVSAHTSGTVEEITWPVQAGRRYALWIDNFTARPVSYTIQHFIMSGTGSDAREDTWMAPVITKSRPPL